jgi:hypothetical protein
MPLIASNGLTEADSSNHLGRRHECAVPRLPVAVLAKGSHGLQSAPRGARLDRVARQPVCAEARVHFIQNLLASAQHRSTAAPLRRLGRSPRIH